MEKEIIKIMADWSVIPVVLIGSFMLVFRLPKGKRLQSYKKILMAGLTSYLLAKVVGYIYQPSGLRPFELIGASAGASFMNNPGFPSDHALFVTAITCAVWFETRNKLISTILASLVFIVCLGRVLALVHTYTDVVGGVVIALLGSGWYLFARSKP